MPQTGSVLGPPLQPTPDFQRDLHSFHSFHSFFFCALTRIVVGAAVALLALIGRVSLHTDEALLTPPLAPRVANQPIVLLDLTNRRGNVDFSESGQEIMAVAHQQHGVVHRGVPAAAIKDARLVVAPRFAIHRHHHGPLPSTKQKKPLLIIF